MKGYENKILRLNSEITSLLIRQDVSDIKKCGKLLRRERRKKQRNENKR